MNIFKGKWEDFLDVKLPENIINRKISYTKSFPKFIENVLNIPISYLYIYLEKYEKEFNMEISLYISNSGIIRQYKESKEQFNWSNSKRLSNLLHSKNPQLKLKLILLKDDDDDLFDLHKNNVTLQVWGNERELIPYFERIIELYFEEFVQNTLKRVVYLTIGKYNISEKDFIERHRNILEDY